MTVREAFAICCPGVPEDASIHVGVYGGFLRVAFGFSPSYVQTTKKGKFIWYCYKGEWSNDWKPDRCSIGPDISSRDAQAFIGFFGPEFDATVEGG